MTGAEAMANKADPLMTPERIRAILKASRLSDPEFAKDCAVGVDVLAAWLNGDDRPTGLSLRTLGRIEERSRPDPNRGAIAAVKPPDGSRGVSKKPDVAPAPAAGPKRRAARDYEVGPGRPLEPTIPPPQLITHAQAAVMVGISRNKLLRWARGNSGGFPSALRVVEWTYLFSRAEVEAWCRSGQDDRPAHPSD